MKSKSFFFLLLICATACCDEEYISLNEAVRYTLANQKEIQISVLNIKNQAGVLQASAGPFDPILTNNDDYTRAHDTMCLPPCTGYATNIVTAESSLTKTTRIGTSFTLNALYRRYSSKSSSSEVTFLVDQPLLRNFYYGINRQIEEANRLELEAVQWDTLFLISTKILDTVNNYWSAVAAKESYEALQGSVERLERVTSDIQRLITGNELAANDKNQSLATLALIKQQLINARYTNYSAKQLLLLSMGKVEEERCSQFEESIQVDPHLPYVPQDLNFSEYADPLISEAFVMRFDLLASLMRQAEGKALVIGAKNQALPDLNVFGSYTRHNANIREFDAPCTSPDFATSPIFVCQESEWRVGINLSVPIYNSSAVGFLKQQEALFQQNVLKTQLLKQNIIVNILDTLKLLLSIEKELNEAAKATELYNTLYENELKKLASGFGSVFELLNFETNRINSLLSLISLKSSYFQALAQLRYQTGTLIVVKDIEGTISFQDVKTLSWIPEETGKPVNEIERRDIKDQAS